MSLKNQLKKIICIFTSVLFMFLSGCGNEEKIENKSTKKNYDLFVFNTDPKLETDFQEMCDEYRERTGVIVKSITAREDENAQELLGEYMNSDTPPNIFMVNNLSEFKKWQETQNTWDFNNATEEDFKEMINSVPEEIRLGTSVTDNFGLPCTVEGYGYILDPKMISALFGGEIHRNLINDLQECTYEEFAQFINCTKTYIYSDSNYDFALNSRNYSFLGQKNELSQNLNGMFSFSAGNKNLTGSYLTGVALASVFNSMGAANIATEDQVKSLETPLRGLMEMLELLTSNVGSKNGIIPRGLELTSTTTNSKNQAIKDFVGGKTLFLFGSTEDYENLNIYNTDVARRSIFIPVKLPIIQQSIKSSATRTEKDFRNSLAIYVPKYYVINSKSSDKEKILSQNFLTWYKESELAQKYTISKFGYTPFDMTEGSSAVLNNTLARSLVSYLDSSHYLPSVFMGAPETWCNDIIGKTIVEQYYTKGVWSFDDYSKVSEYAVKQWLELINK